MSSGEVVYILPIRKGFEKGLYQSQKFFYFSDENGAFRCMHYFLLQKIFLHNTNHKNEGKRM